MQQQNVSRARADDADTMDPADTLRETARPARAASPTTGLRAPATYQAGTASDDKPGPLRLDGRQLAAAAKAIGSKGEDNIAASRKLPPEEHPLVSPAFSRDLRGGRVHIGGLPLDDPAGWSVTEAQYLAENGIREEDIAFLSGAVSSAALAVVFPFGSDGTNLGECSVDIDPLRDAWGDTTGRYHFEIRAEAAFGTPAAPLGSARIVIVGVVGCPRFAGQGDAGVTLDRASVEYRSAPR